MATLASDVAAKTRLRHGDLEQIQLSELPLWHPYTQSGVSDNHSEYDMPDLVEQSRYSARLAARLTSIRSWVKGDVTLFPC